MPLCKSHAYFKKKGERRTERQRLSYATKPPWGVSVFLAFQRHAVIWPRVWPWLLNAASHTRPQFKTRGWEAPSSLTWFSQFSAWLWWETYESTLCAFSKGLVRGWVPPSQMALCRATTAAPDTHRWRTHEGKMAAVFERKAFCSLTVSGLDISHVRQVRKTNSVSNTCRSVSFWHTTSHLCLYFGCMHVVFLFPLVAIPNQFVLVWKEHWKWDISEQLERQKRRKEKCFFLTRYQRYQIQKHNEILFCFSLMLRCINGVPPLDPYTLVSQKHSVSSYHVNKHSELLSFWIIYLSWLFSNKQPAAGSFFLKGDFLYDLQLAEYRSWFKPICI